MEKKERSCTSIEYFGGIFSEEVRDRESKFDGFLCYECEEFEVNMRPHPNIYLMAPFEIKF